MKTIKIDKDKITKDQLLEIADVFLAGKVVAYPTDTVYGLGCLASDTKAVRKVLEIKERKNTKMIVLAKSFCMVHDNFKVSKKQDEFLREVWAPKSTDLNRLDTLPNKEANTVILKSRGLLPGVLENEQGGVGVRIPKDRFLLDLLKKINQLIISTSLNIAGKDVISDPKKIEEHFNVLPDFVLDAGPIKTKKSSSIFDISDISDVKKLR